MGSTELHLLTKQEVHLAHWLLCMCTLYSAYCKVRACLYNIECFSRQSLTWLFNSQNWTGLDILPLFGILEYVTMQMTWTFAARTCWLVNCRDFCLLSLLHLCLLWVDSIGSHHAAIMALHVSWIKIPTVSVIEKGMHEVGVNQRRDARRWDTHA